MIYNPDKNKWPKVKTKQIWRKVKNVDIFFFVMFERYFKKFISGGETGA